MQIDLHSKAVQLLEKIANSIHDRSSAENPNLISFSTNEVQVVEKWLEEFTQEHQKSRKWIKLTGFFFAQQL